MQVNACGELANFSFYSANNETIPAAGGICIMAVLAAVTAHLSDAGTKKRIPVKLLRTCLSIVPPMWRLHPQVAIRQFFRP